MIVKDEEEVLARCLDSVKDAVDEIIIVDTGSRDKTKKIANFYTTKVFNFRWKDDFSAARNFSFSKATSEYILWLDADDVLLPGDKKALIDLKNTLDNTVDAVMMKYNVSFDKQGNTTLSYYRERLVKRERNFKWKERVHEYINISGNILNSAVAITHKKTKNNPTRNLRIYQNMQYEGEVFTSRSIYYYAKELLYNKKYDSAIFFYKKFLGTKKAWTEEYIYSCLELSKCYHYKNDKENELRYLLKSFEYDVPRAEICCQLGYYYEDIEDYYKASFWFETAYRLKPNENHLFFSKPDCYGYIPCLELCICYYNLGNLEEAIRYNTLAEEYKPNDYTVLENKKFFRNILK
jgi:Glycosyltransferases involved in cell wall biogenesis